VVIGAGSRRFGLAVDKLMGEEELVIKALEDQLVTSPLVSGASILGDGTIVLILNIPAVVSHLARIPAVGATA
jgi:two-component system, chemotaxis family, sensor kinase CheA